MAAPQVLIDMEPQVLGALEAILVDEDIYRDVYGRYLQQHASHANPPSNGASTPARPEALRAPSDRFDSRRYRVKNGVEMTPEEIAANGTPPHLLQYQTDITPHALFLPEPIPFSFRIDEYLRPEGRAVKVAKHRAAPLRVVSGMRVHVAHVVGGVEWRRTFTVEDDVVLSDSDWQEA